VLQRDDLARISVLNSISRAWAEDHDGARAAFIEALVVAPDLDWDPRFPPDLQELFTGGIRAAERAPAAQLDVAPQVGRGAALWLDGAQVAGEGGTTTIKAGRHLLQWHLEDDTFATHVLSVQGGDRLTVLSRDDLAAAALSGSGGEVVLARARGELQDLAAATGADVIYLAQLGEADLLHRFDVASGAWKTSDPALLAKQVQRHRLRKSGSALMVAGAAAVGVGAALGVTGYVLANDLIQDTEGFESMEDYTPANEQYHGFRAQAYIGYGLAGAGVAAFATGTTLHLVGKRSVYSVRGGAQPTARLTLTPSSVGLAVRF